MRKSFMLVVVLLALVVLPSACKKDTCKECTSWEVCPLLTKQCPGYTMTVQQCSGNCCTTDAAQLSCTAAFSGQVVREQIIGDTLVIEAANGSERTVAFINGRENGWVTPSMPAGEVRCVMERKLAEIRALAKTVK